MDALGVSAVEFAREYTEQTGREIKPQTIRQARLDPETDGYRSPPDGWRSVVARLARERLPEVEGLTRLDEDDGGG